MEWAKQGRPCGWDHCSTAEAHLRRGSLIHPPEFKSSSQYRSYVKWNPRPLVFASLQVANVL